MVEIDTLFQTKTAKKNIPLGMAHTYVAYIRTTPWGEKRFAGHVSCCLRKRV